MPTFRWEDIDHSLVRLRLTELAIEMNDRVMEEEARIHFENRTNLNSNAAPSKILEMKQQNAEERARRIYGIYCDVWQKQGHAKCGAFVRAVSARAVLPTFRARTGAIAAEFSRFATATSFPSTTRDAMLNGLRLNMRKLEDRWGRRLEIEAKEYEHAERCKNLNELNSSPENQDHSSTAPRLAKQDTLASRTPSQAPSLPIRSSAPLSEFEATVGKLMVQARRECPAKYLSRTEILRIAVLLDEKRFPVRTNLERAAARTMAEYNKQHSAVAIKSWRSALDLPLFQGAVRKRFSRAEEKYKKATASLAPSAGTPRTSI